ncbi:small multi-drug export protein [Dethiobacter alkaliphilus]|uniref:small multi-drug export protein n=1 Tax=Dethiobacter alkaliphilus TaxID=427926 RepID=UPI002225C2B5|nr:small multi-drug export protein [Dethiobacter alkaliphilus]MCW3490508.1 small multi-drug export protein [Dethiobacter alkaliphilus]
MNWLITIGEYLLIFVLAAVPWFEILIVIPIGIVRGLNPVLVGVSAFVGNFLTVFLLIVFYEKYRTWRTAKKDSSQEKPVSKRVVRAREIAANYGLPGLALLGPLATGTHLAAFIGLSCGSEKRATIYWMTLSLCLWTVAITAATYLGFDLFGSA